LGVSIVKEVIDYLPSLSPYRFMSVITYTNAATDNITSKLVSKISLPENLFIGTIHSYLIRFILHPYGYMCNKVPQYKKYIDQLNSWINSKADLERAQKKVDELVERGLITYDKVLEISYFILKENEKLRDVVGYRMQYLFIDEYQDSRLYQHQIFMLLLRIDNMVLFVGDPHQSIYGFQYTQSTLKNEPKPSSFKETPIIRLRDGGEISVEFMDSNYRSTNTIIKFLCTMNGDLQKYDTSVSDEPSIYYINSNDKDVILQEFTSIIEKLGIEEEEGINYRMILSRTWKLLDTFSLRKDISKVNNNDKDYGTSFNEFKRVVTAIIGVSENKLFREHKIPKLKFRKFVLEMLLHFRSLDPNQDPIKSLLEYKENQCHKLIIDSWNTTFKSPQCDYASTKDIKMGGSILNCIQPFNDKIENPPKYVYSTIHSSKGLEATCVLVIADGRKNESANSKLMNWIQGNKEADDDESRCGYVAFSRARKLLVLASTEDFDSTQINLFSNLGFKSVD
jgi:DNA helicase-2/ATP-dependent DNA helicase PcrA